MPFQRAAIDPQGLSRQQAPPLGSDAPRDNQPVWTQPLSVPQFALLMVVTLGCYALFWTGQLISDVRRHLDPRARVWRYVLGIMIPVTAPFVFYRMAGHVAAFMRSQGVMLGPSRAVMTALLVGAYGISFLTDWDAIESLPVLIAFLLVAILAYVLPWILLHRQLLAVKRKLKPVRWLGEPFSFSGLQIATIGLCGGVWLIGGLGVAVETGLVSLHPITEEGEPLFAGRPVYGPSGDYSLVPASDRWRLVEAAEHNSEADLVLFGPGANTWILVFVNSAGRYSFEDHVDSRRGEIASTHDSLEVEEHRELLPQGDLPISYAFYEGQVDFPRDTNTYWSAIFVTDTVAVEALGRADSGTDALKEMELVVKSLRPRDTAGTTRAASIQ